MKKIILFIALLPFLVTSAFAGEWRTKPVRCGTLQEIDYGFELLKEEYLLNGVGVSYDSDLIAFPVQVGVWVNLETGTWSIIETDGNEGCILASGSNLSFDLLDGNKSGT